VTVPRREFEHVYRDWKGAQGRCRVRIYHATEASGHLPVVIVTDPNDNDGPSVTQPGRTSSSGDAVAVVGCVTSGGPWTSSAWPFSAAGAVTSERIVLPP
jgi:hypothetical protein